MATGTDNGYKTDASGFVQMYSLTWDPNNTTNKTIAGSAVIATHKVSKNTTTPISDYAACFACHGAASYNNGSGGTTSTQVTPFHGLGPAVTVMEPLSGASSSNNHLIFFYGGPTNTGQNQPRLTASRHPGFGSLNHLNPEVAINAAKAFGTNDRKAHDLDITTWEPVDAPVAIKSGTFTIPWDSYGPTPDGGAGTVTVNTGGLMGQSNKSTIVPLVPLSLPTSIAP